ncbi:MAG: Gfo/Idh/MocA family oxidoreductase [Eubacteriales bacterium]|nr:Gfo/Idh/MocA family oxidoreductase [Eubacteriales bacterium]
MMNWGIVGTGYISDAFANGLAFAKNANLRAVCSRSEDSAKAFAQKHGADKYFSNYEDMAACDDIDVVYIGTLNVCHLENVKMYLQNGKHVLCEKPIGVNARETAEMTAAAKKAGLFLMEGMWTRCFPSIQKAIEWVRSGEIGQVSVINAQLGCYGDESGWRFQNSMAGGALLDVGIYNIAITFSMLGPDYQSITGTANIKNGVDIVSTAMMQYKNGAIAMHSNGIRQIMNNGVYIEGSKGRVIIGSEVWWYGKWSELTKIDNGYFKYEGRPQRFEIPYPGTGFQYEAEHVADCIHKGLTESPLMTHAESITIAQTIDKLRKIYGISFPQD